MDPIITRSFFISAGDANAEGELSLTVLATKIIEIATLHANSLGIGNPSMAHLNAGWVLSRLTVEMESYPKVNDTYVLSTWIEEFNKHFSIRNFKIGSPEGIVYGYARSIWMVMDAGERTMLGLGHLSLPREMISGEIVPIPRQEKHIPIVSEADEEISSRKYLLATHEPDIYTFSYCDLDSYRHVNTVRYIALLLNQFSLSEHDASFVNRIELSFLHEASYGMTTELARSDSPENKMSSSFQLSAKNDGKQLLFARIIRKNRI